MFNDSAGALTISSSTVSGNSTAAFDGCSTLGGGVYTASKTAMLSNSTVSGNAASGGTGGANGYGDGGDGGGILLGYGAVMTISNSTVFSNTAASNQNNTDGGGVYAGYSTLYLFSSIVSNNTAGSTENDIGGGYTNAGANWVGSSNALLPLANNGGPTQTIALNSAASDYISKIGGKGNCGGDGGITPNAPTVTTDQRGTGYTRKNPCDIGAFEVPPVPTSTPTSTVTSSNTATVTASNTATFTPSNTATVMLTNTIVPARIDSIGIDRANTFYLRLHNATGNADIVTTLNVTGTNLPIVGNWVGTGFNSIGVFNQTNGVFSLRNTNTTGSPDESFVFGNPNDTPLSGQWSASMTHDGIGVYRLGNSILYVKNTLGSGASDDALVLGNPGDAGIAGDWTGKGFDSPGVYRPGATEFFLSNLVTNGIVYGDINFIYGTTTDLPIAGDWIAQGHDGVGMFRPTTGYVFLKNALTTGTADSSFYYGQSGDLPIAGHWQISYPSIAPPSIVIAKTSAPQPTSAPNNNSGSVPGGNQIGG